MSRFNLKRYFMAGKQIFPKMLVLITLICGMFWQEVYANASADLPWIVDESHYISPKVTKGITRVLAESAHNRNIHVRVLVLEVQGENIREMINQKVMESKNKIPYHWQEKTAFFIINLGTNKSAILLGKDFAKTDPLYESLKRIQQNIVSPLLENGQMENALIQGVVALTTILEGQGNGSEEVSWVRQGSVWLSDHYLPLPIQIGILISIIFGFWKWYRNGFAFFGIPRPVPKPAFRASN